MPLQVGEWFAPAGDGRAPAVVLVHGGYWRDQYDRSLETAVALDLARRGYLCWNIDYRSSVVPWPATFLDVAAAYDHLTVGSLAHRVDRNRVAVVGHSAGGHLAAWLASRHRLPSDAPGHNTQVLRPRLCVPQAGVVCLALAADQHLGSDAAQALMDGTPHQQPERYSFGDPRQLLPSGVASVLIHGAADDVVPMSQSETYVAAAVKSGDDSRLVRVPGDHFVHLDPSSIACQRMRKALARMSQ